MTKARIRTLIITLIIMTITMNHIGTIIPDGREIDSCRKGSTNVTPICGHNMVGIADEGTCGISNYVHEPIPYEAFAGLRVKTAGTIVNYTMYTHSDNYNEGSVKIQPLDIVNASSVELGKIKLDETKSFDLKDLMPKMKVKDTKGLYQLTFISNDGTYTYADLYYDGNKVHYCRLVNQPTSEIETWNKLVAELDPKTCLDMYVGNKNYPITYPTSGQNGSCNHVSEWCDLSDKIIIHDDWSDEAKVFAMVLWMTRNLAYDDYRVQTLHNMSRANKDNAWTDDGHFMYYNHVGQCWDFANALTIMCRHKGIPCTSVENNSHTVNAVWLRNEWVAIDVSVLVKNHCTEENTDPSKWTQQRDGTFTRNYGYYNSRMDTYNQAIATPETTLADRSGMNPM